MAPETFIGTLSSLSWTQTASPRPAPRPSAAGTDAARLEGDYLRILGLLPGGNLAELASPERLYVLRW